MITEKYAIFLILSFILLIAAGNIMGSLTMLTMDKKKDIVVLHSLGASFSLLRRIFVYEGMMISIAGGVLGMTLGVLACLFQKWFGWIKIQGGKGSFVVSQYPVDIQWSDLVWVAIIVLTIGFLTSWIISRRINVKYLPMVH